MPRFQQQPSPTLAYAITLSLVAVFAIDLITPLGYGESVFYLVPVVLCSYVWNPRTPLLVAAACTVLLIGAAFSPARILDLPSAPAVSLPVGVYRTLVAVSTWMTAFIVRHAVTTKRQVRELAWIRSGQRELGALVQGELMVHELGERVLRYLCEYLELPVGALYSVQQPDGTLRRIAAYALDAEASARETVNAGEGLLGQAVKDKRTIRFDDVPDGYLQMSSALGQRKVRHVVIVPTQIDGSVNGAIELGFVDRVGTSEMALLANIAESTGVALRSALYRARQQELLEETRRQADELQSQQEELHTANEELESQTKALAESHVLLEQQQAELEQTNSQLTDQARILEEQRDDLSRAKAELIANAEHLARSNQYKSEFLANMSHELRTPLNTILILAKLLADNKAENLTQDQVKYAWTIHAAGTDLLALLNDILDLSRIEAGRVEVQPEVVEPARIIEALRRTFEPVAGDKQLRFDLEIDPTAARTITTDPMRVQQILRNLLSNAFKFTEAGSVTLSLIPGNGSRVTFAVRDTGVGVAPEQQELIFAGFWQADGTTQRKYGGVGLGLTISRELARRLGGEITVVSAAGRGSTFSLHLPTGLAPPPADGRHRAPPPERLVEALPAPPSDGLQTKTNGEISWRQTVEDDRATLQPGGKSILVIEDDEPFARIVRDLAREHRFQCLVATTAREGIALAERFVPSAVVLDIVLPDGSGLAVLEHLKRQPVTRHIPVHIVSIADHAQQAFELGAIGYAIKPVMREQLDLAFDRLEQKLDRGIRRVLVVEDDRRQQEAIAALLTTKDVEVVSVATGSEALERLTHATFDAMVLDLKLPDISGYDVLDRMAAGEAFSFPPVIVYTGRALSRDEEQRLRRYAGSIIVKGARSPERLLDEVTLFLHQVEKELPPEQQRILRDVRGRAAVLEGKTILVVEDDVRSVFALSSALKPRGAAVLIARNGREALATLEEVASDPDRCIDLVLMDVMMPEMDGLAATRAIRTRDEWRKLPIIALTAKAMPDDREKCLQAGASDYIAKPLDVDKLVSLVSVWIPK